MIHWLGRSLKHKLSFMLIISVLVPLISLGFFSFKTASNLTEEKAIQSGMNTLRQLDANLEFIIQDVENMSIFLIGHQEVQDYLSNKQVDIANNTSIISFLTNLAFSKAYIADITIMPKNDNPSISSSTIIRSGFTDIASRIPDYYVDHPKWWSSLYENLTSSGNKRVITLSRPIRNINTFQTIGMLSISLNQGVIMDYLNQSGFENNSYVLLLDQNAQVMSGPTSSLLYKHIIDLFPGISEMIPKSGSLNYGEGNEKKTILYHTVPNIKWKLLAVIPFEEYSSQNKYVLMLTAVAVGLAILLVVGLVLFFIQRVTRPLLTLTQFLKSTNPEELMPTLPMTATDEVGQLIHSYNKLSERIHRLTEQVKRNESLKKEADMQALQAQINPHFLYNTLSSIHWMALMSKEMQIAEMVGALSDFLRFSLNKGEEFCTAQQEISHSENYANIQSIRYPDKFDIQYYVHPDVRSKMMLKLLLQPLIENAMIHGIQKRSGKGCIWVHAELQDDSMMFTVQDDGIGIAQNKLQDLRSQLNANSDQQPVIKGSYGLQNVHRRLILHYGPDAGLNITSTEGEGTRVSFTLPLVEDKPSESFNR